MKINGTIIKTPSEMRVIISDIDGNSYRNANGKMIRDRLAVKRKLECKWNYLSTAEISVLLKAVKNEFFDVTYLDPQEGTEITKRFYVGDRTSPVYSFGLDLWTDLSMNFIEQ